MRPFTYVWAAVAVLVFGAEAAAARPSQLWENVVCMSLPLYILSLLLPAEDIVGLFGKKFGLRAKSEQ